MFYFCRLKKLGYIASLQWPCGLLCQLYSDADVICVSYWYSPVKADFIRAKYQFLAFVNKHKDAEITLEDINKVCWIYMYAIQIYVSVG